MGQPPANAGDSGGVGELYVPSGSASRITVEEQFNQDVDDVVHTRRHLQCVCGNLARHILTLAMTRASGQPQDLLDCLVNIAGDAARPSRCHRRRGSRPDDRGPPSSLESAQVRPPLFEVGTDRRADDANRSVEPFSRSQKRIDRDRGPEGTSREIPVDRARTPARAARAHAALPARIREAP